MATPKDKKRMINKLTKASQEYQIPPQQPTPPRDHSLEALKELKYNDYSWRVHHRKRFAYIFTVLLILQNIATFGLVAWAMLTTYQGNNILEEFQLILAILVPATLGETAYIVKIIVSWLFKEIPYQTPPRNTNTNNDS